MYSGYGTPSRSVASCIFSEGNQHLLMTFSMPFFSITTQADVRSVVCERSRPPTQYEWAKSSMRNRSPRHLFTVCVDSHAVLEFCFTQQYLVMNSTFFESEPSAIAISSSK